ncbi:MAG: histidinol dehydrogenase [Clostridiales bacterium]|jgi:histidinol dehydrogenase|nr:histidinol dehydrogenase [Clostridiales bacterium]
MIRIVGRNDPLVDAYIEAAAEAADPAIRAAVERIIADVRKNGDRAVRAYNKKFDGCENERLTVSPAEIDRAYDSLDPGLIRVYAEAAENIRFYHERQKRAGFELKKAGGIVLGQRILAISRVGLYIPGGTASYPSSLLMNAVPAVVAGVRELVLVSPPGRDGSLRPEILAAAKIAGVTKICRVGGAQAVAALAYGTESVPRVDKIVGPGNAYVAEAKRQVFGRVGIDMIAGPSEILILADASANPDYLAADMLSQAEHDRMARSILITNDRGIAQKTAQKIEERLKALPRADIARESVDGRGLVILVEDMAEAFVLCDRIAPEHLELATEAPFADMERVKNAGSIFLGHFTPEPLGDYYAGPNHTLPTSGTARFFSPLGVDDFIKKNSYLYYPEQALKDAAASVAAFADSEGLTAHGDSIRVRVAKNGDL